MSWLGVPNPFVYLQGGHYVFVDKLADTYIKKNEEKFQAKPAVAVMVPRWTLSFPELPIDEVYWYASRSLVGRPVLKGVDVAEDRLIELDTKAEELTSVSCVFKARDDSRFPEWEIPIGREVVAGGRSGS